MYRNLRVGIAVPCYNEENLAEVTLKGIPDFVDTIYAINDASKDNTLSVLEKCAKKDARIQIVNNETNLGLGGSMLKVFSIVEESPLDALGVMAGDNQMDPTYLPLLLDALVDQEADFAKANRFASNLSLESMPKYRKIGNIVVSIMTKFATGYYSIFDSQNGYVVYSKKSISMMPKHIIGKRYEYENTILVALSIIKSKIVDVSVPAVYGGETSTINLFGTTLRTINALHKGFWQRIYYKYILRSFHPIALFLFASIVFGAIGIGWILFLLIAKLIFGTSASASTAVFAVLPIIISVQFLLSAITLDIQEERK